MRNINTVIPASKPQSDSDTIFLSKGGRFMVGKRSNAPSLPVIHEVLPPGNYMVGFDSDIGFFLQSVEPFKTTPLYGDISHTRDRIINTFIARPYNTGVMLTGEKGCGKTLLARILSLKMGEDYSIPTILINSAFNGESFNSFLGSIQQPLCIIFDEFEKTYRKGEDDDSGGVTKQESILTLFDGVFQQKRMFIITCNDRYGVDSHMLNRPGRFFYSIDYQGLDRNFIVDYCNSNPTNKEHIESVCRTGALFGKFNFDMLQAIVEEMNRYDEQASEVIKFLNTKPEYSEAILCQVSVRRGKEDLAVLSPHITVSPATQSFKVIIIEDKNRGSEEDLAVSETKSRSTSGFNGPLLSPPYLSERNNSIGDQKIKGYGIPLNPSDIISMDAAIGQFVYAKDGLHIILTRKMRELYAHEGELL